MVHGAVVKEMTSKIVNILGHLDLVGQDIQKHGAE